jgi:hypothetical protein
MPFSKIVMFVITAAVMTDSFSQTTENTVKNKHHFSTHFAYYYFYDPTPITQLSYLNKHYSSSSSVGLSYMQKVDDKNGWSVDLDYYNFVSRKPSNEDTRGNIKQRLFFLFQGNYQRTLFTTPKGSIAGIIGLNFRFGYDLIHISYSPFGTIPLDRSFLDVGIPVGIEAMRYLGNHFHLKMRLAHTFFPYIFQGPQEGYDWDNGSPRNMTQLSFGLGVNF